MRNYIQKLCMVMTILCLSITASAYDFELDGIYYNIKSLEDMTCNVAGCSTNISKLVIPASIELNGRVLNVCDIVEDAFKNNKTITRVIFSNGLKAQIGNNAFSGCANLYEVRLNEVTDIGVNAFYECPKITTIVFPGNLQRIGKAAFALENSDKSDGIEVTFEEGNDILCGDSSDETQLIFYNRIVKSVDLNRDIECFGNTWGKLCQLSIGSKVTMFPSYIGANLNDIDLSATNIVEICDYAFAHNQSKEIILPSKLRTIGQYAFASTSFTSINLPNMLTTIGEGAFFYSSIKDIDLPNSIETIGRECFYRCHGLTHVSIPGSITTVPNNAFYFCDQLTDVDMGDGVKFIDKYAFNDCFNLVRVKLSNTLKK